MVDEFSLSHHFEGKDPVVKAIYERILADARSFGPVVEEPKKTSIHLVNKSAFAGVMTRKNTLILTVKSASPIGDPRFTKTERVSASRFHQETKLSWPDEVDVALVGWLREAYAISG